MRDAARAAVPPQFQQDWQRPGGPSSGNPEQAANAAREASAKIGSKRARSLEGQAQAQGGGTAMHGDSGARGGGASP